MEPEHLREAYMALENVIPNQEPDAERRADVRTNCLSLWLHLLQILDRFVDPDFDIKDPPDTLVQPPPTSGGVLYPPGADPALIDDPKARAEYERAIIANRKKLQNYSLQVSLGRLNQQIPEHAEAFIRTNYTSAAHDQEELSSAIQASIKDPHRKEELSTFGDLQKETATFQLMRPLDPIISFIIAVRDEPRDLLNATIEGLLRTSDGYRREIVLVDDGSILPIQIERPDTLVIRNSEPIGSARSRRTGASLEAATRRRFWIPT